MDEFVVYPAIDLRAGKVVRLMQGDVTRETVYGTDAREVARRWCDAGAVWLHVVNLDGAFGDASALNMEALRSLCELDVCVQFGGGLRSMRDVERAFQVGVARVAIGTLAVEQPALLGEVVVRYGAGRVAVAIDAREGRVRVRGWMQGTDIDALELARRACRAGVRTIIFTDIARDGVGAGVNVSLAQRIASEYDVSVIASGGVASLDDVRKVREAGLSGVIIGRALYEGQIDLREALAC